MRPLVVVIACNVIAALAMLGTGLHFLLAEDKALGLALAIAAVLLARLLVLDVEEAIMPVTRRAEDGARPSEPR